MTNDDQGQVLLPARYLVDRSGWLAASTFGHASAADLRSAADYAAAQ